MPLPFRIGLVCIIAAFVAGQINRGIYRLAWSPRNIGPWSPPADGAPDRKWWDRFPIVGWFGMARESKIHGETFWHRPLLIECAFVLGVALLYVHELNKGFYPLGAVAPSLKTLYCQFAAHFALISLLIVATFIDIDEKTIPDRITVSGALLGLLFAAALPESLPPVWIPFANPPIFVSQLTTTAPFKAPPWLNGPAGLAIAISCVGGWIYGLAPKIVWYRSGVARFFKYLIASMLRHSHTKWYIIGFVVLAGLLSAVWSIGGTRWESLLTSVVGLAAGGAIVWGIRIFAGVALQREAMGFGDVTLMAMMGSFLGWQATVVIFFIAPFSGSVIAILQMLITGRRDIPYGPFLASAGLLCVLAWPVVWPQIEMVMMMFDAFAQVFGIGVGQLILLTAIGFFVLVGISLAIVNLCKRMLGFTE
ncbi:MAG: prepilin peptidase [Planctomycetales bacterium]|nr:prepilin peptidase [Planctomycetales bacterium]